MTARLIVFDAAGKKAVHPLQLHQTGERPELRIVMATSAERLEEWLFFFLRDHGAYIETTEPETVAAALNLPPGEGGIIKVRR